MLLMITYSRLRSSCYLAFFHCNTWRGSKPNPTPLFHNKFWPPRNWNKPSLRNLQSLTITPEPRRPDNISRRQCSQQFRDHFGCLAIALQITPASVMIAPTARSSSLSASEPRATNAPPAAVRMCRNNPLSTESCVLVNFVFIQFRAGVRVCGGLTGTQKNILPLVCTCSIL